MEVMVTMAVTSVVIALAYYTYTTLGVYYGRVSSSGDLHAERLNMRHFLSRDIEQADSIFWINQQLWIYGTNDSVVWQRSDRDSTILLRKQSESEKAFEPGHFLMGCGIDTEINMVNKVQLMLIGRDSMSYQFSKIYPVSIKINKRRNGR